MTDRVTLDGVPLREPVRLGAPGLDATVTRRLAELGLREGAIVTVLYRTAGGGRIVAVDGARIALDRSTLALMPVARRADAAPEVGR